MLFEMVDIYFMTSEPVKSPPFIPVIVSGRLLHEPLLAFPIQNQALGRFQKVVSLTHHSCTQPTVSQGKYFSSRKCFKSVTSNSNSKYLCQDIIQEEHQTM